MILKNIWRFLRKPIVVTKRPVQYGYGIDEFRNDPGNTEAMESFFRSPLGQRVLSVLHNHRPRGYPLRGQATIESCALEHMRREGHEGCLALLEAMGKGATQPQEDLQSTWGADEDEEKPEAS